MHFCVSGLAATVQFPAGWIHVWLLWFFYKKQTMSKKWVVGGCEFVMSMKWGMSSSRDVFPPKTRLSFIFTLLPLITHCFILKTTECRLKHPLEVLLIFHIQICDYPGLIIIWNVSYWLHVYPFSLILFHSIMIIVIGEVSS